MVVVLMGVAGSGKTAVGQRLAERLGWLFVDADDLHSSDSIRKMASGEPLTDADRAPWLERIRAVLAEHGAAGRPVVLACSALKREYRAILRGAGPEVRFVFLRASPDALATRLRGRTGHFFDPALLASQLESLQPPDDALEIDADQSLHEVLEAVAAAVGRVGADPALPDRGPAPGSRRGRRDPPP